MKIFDYQIVCTVCHSVMNVLTTTKDHYDSIQYRFCPLCGANLAECIQLRCKTMEKK